MVLFKVIKDSQYVDFNFAVSSKQKIALTSAPGVFVPTGTTKLLIEAVQKKVDQPVSLLDLGCGTGVVGLALHLHELVKSPLYASDLSEPSVICSKLNLDRYDCSFDVRHGSLFKPWLGHKFDVIVDDISGIAREIADISPWFQGVPCDSGKDGSSLVVEIIQDAPQYLADRGKFFFPVISLSNVNAILDVAKSSFNNLDLVSHQEWPLPDELKEHLPLLEKLNEEGIIKLDKRFGMLLWYTKSCCATN